MREKTTPAIIAHRNRISRPWRICFVLYALALMTGTHWPQLQFGPEIPATDKTVHLLAFGGATLFMALARWIGNLWLCGLVVLLWAAVDEISQNLPGLHRTSHWHDMVANTLGVAVACAWMWALSPVGAKFAETGASEGPNRLRLRALAYSFEDTFAKRAPWIAAVAGALVGAVTLLAAWFLVGVEGKRVAIIVAVVLALLTTAHFWWRQWRTELHRNERERPCTRCGNNQVPAGDRCPSCGSIHPTSLWNLPQPPARALAFKLTIRPTIIALLALVLGFGLILVMPWVYAVLLQGSQTSSTSVFAMRFAQSIGRLPRELVSVIDLSLYLLLFAVGMRIYRAQLAKFYDRAVVCTRCGHDLRGTPTTEGRGHCGECGTPFVRMMKSQ